VREALTATEIEPSMLMLEITETVLMQDTEAMIERLKQLRALGVRLAIDDFGTGYSSLRYLRRFPVDALKMAKPFVDGLAEDTQSAALARTIIDLASNLGIACIAEGIETDAQMHKLRELGCGLGQGFHFARPTPSLQLSELLKTQKFVPAFPV
jgi:EAL domain-containing protein (putative c-di-GMP-specific phosphodiesterase class I)